MGSLGLNNLQFMLAFTQHKNGTPCPQQVFFFPPHGWVISTTVMKATYQTKKKGVVAFNLMANRRKDHSNWKTSLDKRRHSDHYVMKNNLHSDLAS